MSKEKLQEKELKPISRMFTTQSLKEKSEMALKIKL